MSLSVTNIKWGQSFLNSQVFLKGTHNLFLSDVVKSYESVAEARWDRLELSGKEPKSLWLQGIYRRHLALTFMASRAIFKLLLSAASLVCFTSSCRRRRSATEQEVMHRVGVKNWIIDFIKSRSVTLMKKLKGGHRGRRTAANGKNDADVRNCINIYILLNQSVNLVTCAVNDSA